jgi:hypothetical protein
MKKQLNEYGVKYPPRKTGTGRRKLKIRKWIKKGRQKGGFLFTGMALLGSAIYAGLSAAAPAIATGAITAAAGYATTKALQKIGGSKRKNKIIRRRK